MSSDGEIGPCLASTTCSTNGSYRQRRASRRTINSEEKQTSTKDSTNLRRYHNEKQLTDLAVSSSGLSDSREYPDTDSDIKSMASKSSRIEKNRLSANTTQNVVTDLWQTRLKEKLSGANQRDKKEGIYNDGEDHAALNANDTTSKEDDCDDKKAACSSIPPSSSNHRGRGNQQAMNSKVYCHSKRPANPPRPRSRDSRLPISDHIDAPRSPRAHRRDDKLSKSEHTTARSSRSCHYPTSIRRAKRGDPLSRSEHSSCSRRYHRPSSHTAAAGDDQLASGSQEHSSVSRNRRSQARSRRSISPHTRQPSRSLSPVIMRPSSASSSEEKDLSHSLAKRGLQKNWDFAISQALINLAREDAGLKLMSKNEEMNDLAQEYAHHIAHGESAMQKAQYQGHVLCGTTIPSIHQMAMEQEAGRARANILNPNFEEFGTGTAAGKDGQIYICHLFKGSFFDLDCIFLDSSPSTTDMVPEKRALSQPTPSLPSCPSPADATHKDLRGRLMGTLDAGKELGSKMIPGKGIGKTVSSTLRQTLKRTFSSDGLHSMKRTSSAEALPRVPSLGSLKRSTSAEGISGLKMSPFLLSEEGRPSRPTRRNQVEKPL
jgi:hypothetical protein